MSKLPHGNGHKTARAEHYHGSHHLDPHILRLNADESDTNSLTFDKDRLGYQILWYQLVRKLQLYSTRVYFLHHTPRWLRYWHRAQNVQVTQRIWWGNIKMLMTSMKTGQEHPYHSRRHRGVRSQWLWSLKIQTNDEQERAEMKCCVHKNIYLKRRKADRRKIL
jgi:hypothetical protein